MKYFRVSVIFGLFATLFHGGGKNGDLFSENRAKPFPLVQKSQNVRIVFYNLENLYDPCEDLFIPDEDFTPAGKKHWTWSKFREKEVLLSKVILAIGEWKMPVILGFCEVENRFVLQKLVSETPLSVFHYRILHHDSPDARGMDVAMIYLPDHFILVKSGFYPVVFPDDTVAKTREILYAKGILENRDTLHLFVNHWPSRRGGEEVSAPKRKAAALVLKHATDSIFSVNPCSNIIIMGDFNDEAMNTALKDHLQAKTDTTGKSCPGLYNLMAPQYRKSTPGSHKYQGAWAQLDQFIVSGSMLTGFSGFSTDPGLANNFTHPVLFEQDTRFGGDKPKRTYNGPAWHRGLSDHLPVYLEIKVKSEE